jgi:hypothetical protein
MFLIFSGKCYELKNCQRENRTRDCVYFFIKVLRTEKLLAGRIELETVSYIQKQRTEKQPVGIVCRAQQQPGVCGSCLATDQVGVKHLPGCTCVSLRVWHAPTRLGRPFFFFLYFFPIFYFVVLVLGI